PAPDTRGSPECPDPGRVRAPGGAGPANCREPGPASLRLSSARVKRLLALLGAALLAGVSGCRGCAGAGPADAGSPPPVAARPAAAPAKDRDEVVQAPRDSTWVQTALEPSGNAGPLVVVAPGGLEGAGLKAFGQTVKLLTPEEAQAQRPESYLELSAVHLEG